MNRTTVIGVSLGILITLSALLLYSMQIPRPPPALSYGEVTVAEAKALLESNREIIIVDVRTSDEYARGHLEGALLIPLDELEGRLEELSKEEELLIYCRLGNRSTTAVNILQAQNYTNIYHMHEGITAWIQAGYPTVASWWG